MSATITSARGFASRLPYYGWTMVAVGAVLMAATLPGRTHGVGLITKRLVEELEISNVTFAQLNLWATLLGAVFCFPCGWLLDRYGLRKVAPIVLAMLAGSVIAMSNVESTHSLGIALLLTRGLGQSMLSVVSITVVAKWFRRRISPAMGAYAILMSVLMAAATGMLGSHVAEVGWREAWAMQGWTLLFLVVPIGILAKDAPKNRSDEFDSEPLSESPSSIPQSRSATLLYALRTPCFWMFTLSISFFGLISSGLSLFNQFVLEERGFDESVYHTTLVIGLVAGMIANLITGAFAKRFALERLLAGGLFLLALSLAGFPFIKSSFHVYSYAVMMGFSGGVLTVLFFSVWGHAFGPKHLGKIQAAAQMVTVVASAMGPVLVAISEANTGSYLQVFELSSLVALVLTICALCTRVPHVTSLDHSNEHQQTPAPESLM
jgi:MFS family permease